MMSDGSFECAKCGTTVFSFMEHRGPPPNWRWDAEADQWYCSTCAPKWPDDFRGFGSNVRPRKQK